MDKLKNYSTKAKSIPQNNFIISKYNFSSAEAVPNFNSVRLPRGLVNENFRDSCVEHNVQVGAVLGRSQESPRYTQAGTVAVRGLGDGEACVCLTV